MSSETTGWQENVLAARSANMDSLGVYCASMDKEIAMMAAYKSLGMDPRDIPRFGWGLMQRPSVSQTIVNGNGAAAVSPILGTSGARIGFLILCALIIGALGYLAYKNMPPVTPITTPVTPVTTPVTQNLTPAVTPLQQEICIELEADPAFNTEVKGDLAALAQKIKNHKDARLRGK